MAPVTHYLYKIQPTRPELPTQGPTPEEAALISQEAAREIMNNDPAVKQRVMRAELYPYAIALPTSARKEARDGDS